MANISGQDVKREIIKTRFRGDECKAVIAGFVRSCMSISITKHGTVLQLDCQTESVRRYIESAVFNMFGVRSEEEGALVYSDCAGLLKKLSVIDPRSDGFEMLGIPRMDEGCEAAYVCGMFLGCGSFSAHDRGGEDVQRERGGGGYHLEFSVLSESLADELKELLERRGVSTHKMERAEKYVVYTKNIENVSNCLALMGLGRLVVRINDTAVAMSIKRDVNRRINCDMANTTRVANASADVLRAIEYISAHSGLDTLPPKLLEAADARVNSPEAALGDIAFELGISKSGLKHRFDSIIEIAEKLKHKSSD